MLKKLFRQEWKSFSFAPLIAMIILAVITLILAGSFMTPFWEQDNIFLELFASLTIIAYFFSLAALSFCVTLCTAVRFYKNLFTDEGYLMFTLPVKTSELLLSKTLVSVLWKFISFIFTVLSILMIAFVAIARLDDKGFVRFFQQFSDLLREALSEMQKSLMVPVPLFFLWLILLGISSILFSTLFIYTCICIGQLWNSHKIGGAIAAYFGLRFVFRLFRQILTMPLSEIFSSVYDVENITAGTWLLTMFLSLLVMGGLCVALYCICSYIMSRKLNLD